jgi:zinc transport system substrate-binding protein
MSRLAALLLVAIVAGCGDVADDGRLRVAVSVPPQAFLVERIGGPHVGVVTLAGPGDSPATYQPTDLQVSEVVRARVYFRIGVPFENGKWLEAVADAPGVRVVDVREGVRLRDLCDHDHGGEHRHEGKDPHIWLAPGPLATQARTVAAVLSEIAPEHAAEFGENLTGLLAEIDAADAEVRRILEPFRGRRFFVFHPAWGYFCDAYGLIQTAIEVEGKEPSEHELTALLEQARREGARVVFVQTQIKGQSAAAVAAAVGAEIRRIDPLAPNVPENLVAVARAVAESMQ